MDLINQSRIQDLIVNRPEDLQNAQAPGKIAFVRSQVSWYFGISTDTPPVSIEAGDVIQGKQGNHFWVRIFKSNNLEKFTPPEPIVTDAPFQVTAGKLYVHTPTGLILRSKVTQVHQNSTYMDAALGYGAKDDWELTGLNDKVTVSMTFASGNLFQFMKGDFLDPHTGKWFKKNGSGELVERHTIYDPSHNITAPVFTQASFADLDYRFLAALGFIPTVDDVEYKTGFGTSYQTPLGESTGVFFLVNFTGASFPPGAVINFIEPY